MFVVFDFDFMILYIMFAQSIHILV